VRDLQRASRAAGVTFVSIAAVDRAPTFRSVGRLELRLSLRGSYVNLKAVCSEVVARQPSAVVQRIAMRQAAGPGDLEAQVDLLLLSRPLTAQTGG